MNPTDRPTDSFVVETTNQSLGQSPLRPVSVQMSECEVLSLNRNVDVLVSHELFDAWNVKM